jgi:hypothetical protein
MPCWLAVVLVGLGLCVTIAASFAWLVHKTGDGTGDD